MAHDRLYEQRSRAARPLVNAADRHLQPAARPAARPSPGILDLQRLVGNRAACAALRDQPDTLRRYFVHTPRNGAIEGSQFQAQEKASGATSFVGPTTKSTTVTEPSSKRPPLRVSDDGRLAMEDTDLRSRQAKVFYAEPGVVADSNARLLETGSKYRLFIDQPGAVKVPSRENKTPHNLSRVLPRDLDSADTETGASGNEGLKMDVQATCDEVAQAITHTGNIGDYPVLKKSIQLAIGFGELQVARYMTARMFDATPDEALQEAETALQLGPQHASELKKRTDAAVSAYDDQLRANAGAEHGYSEEEKADLEAKGRARVAAETKSQMERELKADISHAYGKLLASKPRLANQIAIELGINRHALPEVGQAFGSINMRAKDKRDWTTGRQRTEDEGGTWGSHYGGVVAKSGGDMVTLENYARNRENAGIDNATSAMYYFQMYGTEKGQTWHEVWGSSDRRVVNPLTQVMGHSYQEIWTGQLAGVPSLAGSGDAPAYKDLLAAAQDAVRGAANREEAMVAYRRGLLNLVVSRFHRYAQAAFDIAVEAEIAEWSDPFPLKYGVVVPKLDAWLASKGPARSRSLLSRGSNPWKVQSAALQALRDAIVEVHGYYADRFPAQDAQGPGGQVGGSRTAKGKGKDAKQDDKRQQEMRAYFFKVLTDLAKYENLKVRHAHYEGEEVDASSNPMITDGRKAVANLRKQGMSDDDIRKELLKLFPAYTRQDIDTYFLATATVPQVAYLDSTRRTDYELTRSGSKVTQKGKPFDTRKMFSSGAGAGYSIFVMSSRGEIFANEHKPGLFHHSSFLAGLPTAAAGELKVKDGTLQQVTNKSGHYHPGAAQTYQVLTELKTRGIPLSSFGLSIKGIPDTSGESKFNGEYPKARQFADEFEKG
ncbi:MAG TPA: hypothetical protein VHT30_02070 [Acidimicrobiales bacterium]|nr:hypothetical protein [Acidimicrobiales bacterium]